MSLLTQFFSGSSGTASLTSLTASLPTTEPSYIVFYGDTTVPNGSFGTGTSGANPGTIQGKNRVIPTTRILWDFGAALPIKNAYLIYATPGYIWRADPPASQVYINDVTEVINVNFDGSFGVGAASTEGWYFDSLTTLTNCRFTLNNTFWAPNLTTLNNCFVGDGVTASSNTARIIIKNAKLTAETVNNFLIAMANYPDQEGSTGTVEINFSGGTSAGSSQLTAQGTAAVSTMVGYGYIITLNA